MQIPDYSRDAEAFERLRESYSFLENCHHEGRKASLRLARLRFFVARRFYLLYEQLRRHTRRLSILLVSHFGE